MTKAGEKIIRGTDEAISYAKGKPVEGTRETWYDPITMQWVTRVFENGQWKLKD